MQLLPNWKEEIGGNFSSLLMYGTGGSHRWVKGLVGESEGEYVI